MKISSIIDKIDNKGIFVPAFQREFVWKREDAKALINSLINNYPTGTILTWETMSPPELKKAEYKPEMGSVLLVLDGQQRITTLYMLITGKIPPYYTEREIENDIRGLYYNLQTGELEYYMQTKMKDDPFWIEVTEVFASEVRVRQIMAKYKEKNNLDLNSDEFENLYNKVEDNLFKLKSIKDRDFPQLEVPPTANIVQAIDIFDIVNSSGTKLTDAELALAQISGKWPQAREVFKKKLFSLKDAGYEFNLDFIVYLLQSVLHFTGSDMKSLHRDSAEVIQQAWHKLDSKILDYTINILKNRAYIDSTEELSSVYNLVPFITYIYIQPDNTLNDNQINDAINWLLLSLLWQRYISQLPQKLDLDLRMVRDNKINPFDDLRNQISDDRGRLDLKADDMTGRGTSHPIYKLMILAAKSNNAICWGTGNSLRNNIGEKYKIESDHIFPYSKLRDMGYNRGNHLKYKLAQELTNRALITKDANMRKLAKEPSDYLPQVNDKYPGALEKQYIPMDTEIWKMDKFEVFLEKRRHILAEAINDFINNYLAQESDTEDKINIMQLISYGESEKLEFKSSFRYDSKINSVNKEKERFIMKAICGLLNADGGSLIVGVHDDGSIIGIENDLGTLPANDTDALEIHFNNIFNSMIGVEYRQYVSLLFQKVDDKLVCLIKTEPSDEPAYLKIEGKEDFYVRTGNATYPMSFSQAQKYRDTHWKD